MECLTQTNTVNSQAIVSHSPFGAVAPVCRQSTSAAPTVVAFRLFVKSRLNSRAYCNSCRQAGVIGDIGRSTAAEFSNADKILVPVSLVCISFVSVDMHVSEEGTEAIELWKGMFVPKAGHASEWVSV